MRLRVTGAVTGHVNLEACRWQFDGDILVIRSATSAARYTVDAQGCKCRLGDAGC